LVQLVTQTLEIFQSSASTKGLRLTVSIPPTFQPYVMGDALRIRQVLNNLLSNAIKFTDVGSIRVCVQVCDTLNGDQLLLIAVQDTGIGIDAEAQQRLFQSFQQADSSTSRKYGGTGLGLKISRELVRLMGGYMSITSAAGEGSTLS